MLSCKTAFVFAKYQVVRMLQLHGRHILHSYSMALSGLSVVGLEYSYCLGKLHCVV